VVSNELLDELRQLAPADKLRVVQILVNDLATQVNDNLFLSNRQYEVWSPYDVPFAAETLLKMLEDDILDSNF
jgi:hypothetical protein